MATLSIEHWWLGSCTVTTLSWFEGHWPATHTLHKFCFLESSNSTALLIQYIFSTSLCCLRLCLRGIYFMKWFGLIDYHWRLYSVVGSAVRKHFPRGSCPINHFTMQGEKLIDNFYKHLDRYLGALSLLKV